MRATKGYVVGVGTTGALIGAIGCAFAVLSAVVAVHGWPLALSLPGTSTVEGGDAPAGAALAPLDVFPAAAGAGRGAPAGDAARRGTLVRTELGHAGAAPVASAFGVRGRSRSTAPGERAGSPPDAGAARVAPSGGVQSGADGGPVGADGSASPTAPASTGEGPETLGGAVAQVTSGAGTAVSQTGQQLGGAVQGATSQLGGAVGQVSPAAGQLLTQTGEVVGGVVSGTTGGLGQVVTGTGATAGRLLGGLAGAR